MGQEGRQLSSHFLSILVLYEPLRSLLGLTCFATLRRASYWSSICWSGHYGFWIAAIFVSDESDPAQRWSVLNLYLLPLEIWSQGSSEFDLRAFTFSSWSVLLRVNRPPPWSITALYLCLACVLSILQGIDLGRKHHVKKGVRKAPKSKVRDISANSTGLCLII